VFFSPQNINFPLFEETLRAFLFFPLFPFSFFSLFSILFSPFFYAPSLEDLGILMIFEEKNHCFKNFLFKWLDMDGMVMTVDILAVDTYSEMELCTSI
jgi:hypothetical protein